MKKLWQKETIINVELEAFETKDDIVLDQKLLPYDLLGTMAHVLMLKKIGLLTTKECSDGTKGLKKMMTLFNKGSFTISFGEEDMHTKIETYLTDYCGEVGKKVHTGRSRNDQVLTAIRLYIKEMLLNLSVDVASLAQTIVTFAKVHEYVPLAGYTHMQKAMPSSLGMWAAGFAESLLDDLMSLENALTLVDQSPLGSAAGYGVPIPLDRDYSAQLLGFKRVQVNPIYCQNSRGKIEATVLSSLVQLLMTINKITTDVLLFTTSEFNYFSIDQTLTSGSSIMPQKKNIDIAELLRAKVHDILSSYVKVVSISSNLPSGYNRDIQDTKKPLIESLELSISCIKMTKLLIENLQPNKTALFAGMTPELLATHKAFSLVKEGMSFREAYQQVGSYLEDLPEFSIGILKQSTHIGGTGNLHLAQLFDEVLEKKKSMTAQKKKFGAQLEKLLKGGETL